VLYDYANVIDSCKKKVLKVGHLIVGIFKNSFYGSLTFVKFLSQQRNRCNAISRSLTKEERNLFVFFHPSHLSFVFISGDSVLLLSYNFE
jgi:hypothetical protein